MNNNTYPTIADWRRDLAAVRADGTGFEAMDMFVEYAGDARFMESLTVAERFEVYAELRGFADVMSMDVEGYDD